MYDGADDSTVVDPEGGGVDGRPFVQCSKTLKKKAYLRRNIQYLYTQIFFPRKDADVPLIQEAVCISCDV